MKIFNGRSNLPLATKICENLKIPLGNVYVHDFPSKEIFVQFKENLRGEDVFLIQGAGSGSANDNLMELLIMADAARRASAERITAVMPMFFYERQDRKNAPRTPISAKLVMDLLQASGINRILTMDLHAEQIQGFSNIPVDNLYFEPILIKYINEKFKDRNLIIMAPDVGAVKRAEKYADKLKCDFGFISKKRMGDEHVELQSIVGNVKHKHVIIIDDLTESFGTLDQAAIACDENGARMITCCITHGCFTSTGCTRIQDACINEGTIKEFIYSDTVDIDWDNINGCIPFAKPPQLTQLSVSNLFAKAIENIHNNQSISELFL